jgi:hypothetical protein
MARQIPGHVDQVLTNIAVGFSQMPGFIADQIFPVVPVKNESDTYWLYGREKFKRVETTRQRGSEANEYVMGHTTASYLCDEDALEGFIDDRDYDNFDSPLDPEADLVEDMTEVLQLGYEIDVASLVRDTGTYPDSNHYANPTAKFDTGGSSITMQADIIALQEVVRKKIGRIANTIVIPPRVAYFMSADDEITNIVKYIADRGSIASMEYFARGPEESWLLPKTLWGMRVLVPQALEDVSKENFVANPNETITTSLTDVWGDDIWIGYVQPRPGVKKVSFGYTFEQRAWKTSRWREDKRQSNAFLITRILDRKVVCSAAGALLQDCLTEI